jgi:hypothetical protein
VNQCVAFSPYLPLPVLRTSIDNPPLPNPREYQHLSTRRFTVKWYEPEAAIVQIDEWTVAYFDFAKGKTAMTNVDLGLKTRDTELWVDKWKAESKRLELLAVKKGPPNQAL